MKYIFKIFYIVVFVIILSSCATSTISIRVLKPAEVTLPKALKKVVIANRSLPGDERKVENVVEGILTGEGLMMDRFASKHCISGLEIAMGQSDRYHAVVPSGLDLRGTGTGEFPAALPWGEVEEICNKYNADALILLETFDSDSKIKYAKDERTAKRDDKTYKYMVYIANQRIRVTSGWRIYYPEDKNILDANVYTDYREFTAEGKTRDEARRRLPSLYDATKKTGIYAGEQYAYHITPNWIRVSRSYFKKGNEDLKRSKNYVKHNEWEDAADIWLKHVDAPDPKIAGRACYNMALAEEMNGDLQ